MSEDIVKAMSDLTSNVSFGGGGGGGGGGGRAKGFVKESAKNCIIGAGMGAATGSIVPGVGTASMAIGGCAIGVLGTVVSTAVDVAFGE
jgi:hypothetical protein